MGIMTAKIRKTESPLGAEAAFEIRRNPPRNMNLAEAAAYVGVSPKKLRNDVRLRRIPAVRLGGRIIFRIEDVNRALEKLSF